MDCRVKQRYSAIFTCLLVILFCGVLPVSVTFAQTRSVYWEHWDVTIDDVDAARNFFTVTEDYAVDFTGTFRFGTASIPTNRLERISDVSVLVEGRLLTPSCSGSAGTFCVASETIDGVPHLSITYYFPSAVSNEQVEITLSYDVWGGIRIYPEGDQLWWDAVPSEHYGFTIGSSTVIVELPQGYAPREGIDPVVTYGVPGDVQVNGTRVVARATRPITGDEFFSIRVQFPHNLAAQPPSWQAGYDVQRAYDESVRPILNIGFGGLSLLIGAGGVLLVVALYLTRGRDPEVGVVPEYLTEPPSSLPPAIVGSLVDEKVDLRDMMSTLVDLARRDYLVIEEAQVPGPFGIGTTSTFIFKRTDKPAEGLHTFENTMLEKVFPGNSLERSLDSMRNTFYTALPIMQQQLYQALVSEGLFDKNPNNIRNTWSGIGGLLIILSIFAICGAFVFGISIAETLLCIPAATLIVGVVALVAGNYMPAKTRKGAEESAKWLAFRQYLLNLEKYTDIETAATNFDQYLSYAMAFGIERSWMFKFKGLTNVPVPTWYFPTYLGGPWGRGYVAGSPPPHYGGSNLPGEIATADGGGFSFDRMSGDMTRGLESMSVGLSNMLNSASQVMSSRPQPQSSGSWSSGGSGWSGGGFSGGGGSGGGSRGFG
jgi:uncharacterized membrane protein YgcG